MVRLKAYSTQSPEHLTVPTPPGLHCIVKMLRTIAYFASTIGICEAS